MAPGTYRVLKDHLGGPRLLLDSQTGAIAQRLDYDEFGIVEGDTAPGFQPFGFAGGLYDPDTGLVHFGVRDYDAEAGRWISKDPLQFSGLDANFYVYSFNDPVNLVDRTGRGACTPLTEEDKAAIDAMYDYYDPFQPRESAGRICRMPNQTCEHIMNVNSTNSPRDSSDPGPPSLCQGLPSPAIWHSHGADEPGYTNEDFSPRDISRADDERIPEYLFTPGGRILKYTPKTNKMGAVPDRNRRKGRFQRLNADKTAFCNYKWSLR